MLCALEGTTTTNTLKKADVLDRVRRLVPSGDDPQVRDLAASALERLIGKGRPVHLHKAAGGYCLSFERTLRTKDKIAEYVENERALESELSLLVEPLVADRSGVSPEYSTGIAKHLRLGIEHLLLSKGEAFAAAVSTGQMPQIDASEASRILAPKFPSGFELTIEGSS